MQVRRANLIYLQSGGESTNCFESKSFCCAEARRICLLFAVWPRICAAEAGYCFCESRINTKLSNCHNCGAALAEDGLCCERAIVVPRLLVT